MNEEQVRAGLTTYLKARAVALPCAIAVIGRGDAIPVEGSRLHIGEGEIEIVCAGLCYYDLEITVINPAKQDDATADFSTACGFLRLAMPARDETQRTALATAISTATSSAITLHWYHHGDTDTPTRDEHLHQRIQHLRLALAGSTI